MEVCRELNALISNQRVPGENKGHNYSPSDEMFLDDTFQNLRRTGVIPNPFGIDDSNGAVYTDPEAVGFGAENQRFRIGEAEFFQASFQKFPSGKALCFGAAFGVGLVCAQENMPLEFFQPQFLRHGFQIVRHNWLCWQFLARGGQTQAYFPVPRAVR